MRRKEVLFGVIGGVVGAVLVMAVGLIAPIGAQHEVKDVTFGSVICTGISVGSSDRGESIWITPGEIHMMTPEGHGVLIYAAKGSGTLNLGQGVRINGGSKEGGGSISVSGENGAVEMEVDEHGGMVRVSGKDGEKAASMVISEYGGRFGVFGKDGKGVESANIAIDEYGGTVSVFGWGSNYSRARMGVNEDGNGAIKTWDKNGYRLATLK